MSLTDFRTLGRSGLVVSPLALRAGKIRYFGFSDMPAWVAMKAATIAAERRVPGPIAMQLEYSLVAREAGMGVMPWSPLAGGLLSGKYSKTDTCGSGRLSGPNPFGNSKFTEQNWAILDVLRSVALELDQSMAETALAWTMARPGIASTLIGASKLTQLHSNIAATEIKLSASQTERLDTASTPPLTFSASLTATPSAPCWLAAIRSPAGRGNCGAGAA